LGPERESGLKNNIKVFSTENVRLDAPLKVWWGMGMETGRKYTGK
jgi:hypothetical protein